jgi:hypothetical protein
LYVIREGDTSSEFAAGFVLKVLIVHFRAKTARAFRYFVVIILNKNTGYVNTNRLMGSGRQAICS